MIPKVIHYCWFGGKEKSPVVLRCIASWRVFAPQWTIREWSEDSYAMSNIYLRTAHSRALWSKISNLARLDVLDSEGGVYLDADVELRQPLDVLLAERCFVAFQTVDECADWVNNAVLGAEAGHHFLRDCKALTLRHFEVTKQFALSPRVTTQVLRSYGLTAYGEQRHNDVTVLGRESFYPYGWHEQFTEECVTTRTMGVHHWERSHWPQSAAE